MTTTNILIVEDEAIVALELKYRLKKFGYNVCGVSSTGARAIQLAEEHKPDLVLMDVKLKGGMNGIEAASIIFEKFGIPSIFLSAFSDNSTKKEMHETNNFEYLQKPFEVEDLKAAIERLLKKKNEPEIN